MIKIISDSTAYITKEYAEENDITIIPLRYLLKDKEYEEGYPGTFDEFFKVFTSKKIFPKTSQPSIQLFIDEYNKAIDAGNDVIVFTISGTMSGTNNTANLAKAQCKDPSKIYVFDSQSLAQTIFGFVMEAVNMRNEGKTAPEIMEHLEKCIPNSAITFVPDSLEYIEKGGRIGRLTAKIGSLLQIKPIVTFTKGILSDKKVIGFKKAVNEMLASIPKTIKRIFILHIAHSPLFEKFKLTVLDFLKKRPDNGKFEIYEGELGPVVSTHAGPSVGFAWTSV